MRYGFFAFVFGLLLLALPALSADPAPWEAGRFDGQIIDALNAACKALPLHETRLKDVAPQYWVETDPALTWTDAVKTAEDRYPDDQVKRILFMARYLKEGDPLGWIEQMDIPAGFRSTLATGGGRTTSYDIGAVKVETAPPVRQPDGTIVLELPYKPSPIRLNVSDNYKTIFGCTIGIHNLQAGDVTYQHLSFNMDGTLRGFVQQIPVPDAGVTLLVGGNTSGEGGKNHYYGSVQTGEQHITREMITLTSDLTLAERSVDEPDGHTPLYREVYKDGKLAKRTWYKTVKTDAGTETIIDRTETFE
ncbi:MAG: hypothetical protein ACYDCO_10140 [Armatimonadota bacterium]